MGTLSVLVLLIVICICMPSLHLSTQACKSSPLHLHRFAGPKNPYRLPYTTAELGRLSVPRTGSSIVPLKTASSLLALLGGKTQFESVDSSLSSQILPCLRFLIPPEHEELYESYGCIRTVKELDRDYKSNGNQLSYWTRKSAIDKLIRQPPPAVAELARKVVEWNGDTTVIINSLSEKKYTVPDVEGANEQRCQLTKYTYGHRFENKELNQYIAFLFEAIADLAPSIGFNVTLNRFDLFHGHLFLAYNTGRLGILFHAREYPAYDEETFPVHLGYCQVGSPVIYDESMNLRNILWMAPMPDLSQSNITKSSEWVAPGALLVLDSRPDGIVYKDLVPEYVDVVRTVYEADFGDVVVDINYFSTANDNPEDRVFIC